MDEFNDNEKELLKGHFSNIDKQVFIITTPSQIDRVALLSRYSRSSKSMRRIFLEEFLNNPERGEKFYNKVLVEYGDDSVAELGLIQLAIEDISNIAVKSIEDRRIGLSYLEKSTRYVRFDQKINNRWKYYIDNTLSKYNIYKEAADLAFETYSRLIDPMINYLKEIKPIDDLLFKENNIEMPFHKLKEEEAIKSAINIYNTSIRAETLDILRVLLPASTLTNLGIAGNIRAFEYLLSILYASELEEERNIAEMIYNELYNLFPSFVRRVKSEYGKELELYIKNRRNECIRIASKYVTNYSNNDTKVRLIDYDKDADIKVVASILYQYSSESLNNLIKLVRELSNEEREEIIHSYLKHRKNRRHRVGRAFELPYYTFELLTNYGIFRDLHRHRILTMERQLLTTKLGYEMPEEFIAINAEKDFKECMSLSNDAYNIIAKDNPYYAQYIVLFAYKYRYFIKMNLREAYHLIELRTSKQGHRDYRNVAQDIYREIYKVNKTLLDNIFVDLNDYRLARFDSEKRKEDKLRQI